MIEIKEFYLLFLVGGVCEVVHSPHQQVFFFSPWARLWVLICGVVMYTCVN